MGVKLALIVLLSVAAIGSCQQQNNQRIPENARRSVAPHLQVCYSDRRLFERDSRLPMNVNTLIELIRRVENTPGLNMDIRQLSIAILQRFKQDGILPTRMANVPEGVLPFSPSDFTSNKHRVQAIRLLRDDNIRLPNGTLTNDEMCALHFMLSNSIETQIRGDEATRCNQLAQYRSARIPRFARDDFEMIEKNKNKLKQLKQQRSGKLQDEETSQDPEDYPVEEHQEEANEDTENEENHEGAEEEVPFGGRNTDVELPNTARSRCPVENGVIQSPWGAISAGNVLMGIATGLSPQNPTVNEISPMKSAEYRMARQQDGVNVGSLRIDSRFAGTLAGDLAEVVLLQASQSPNVGASGTFNSTFLPRWHFLTQQDRFQMTDAEIRGGLDGLILAQNIAEWRTRSTNLRLSQVLSMYYSQRGVFTPEFRACNRSNFFTTVAPIARLRDETTAFSVALDQETITSVTLNHQAIQRLSGLAADALSQYVVQTLRDPGCQSTARNVNDPTEFPMSTDIYIYVDTTSSHMHTQALISDLFTRLEFGTRATSNYTILGANDARPIMETNSLGFRVAVDWTPQVHAQTPAGFNFNNILISLRNRTMDQMMEERARNTVGGRSKIALIVVPGAAVVTEEQAGFAHEQLRIIRETVPDLRILFWAAGSTERFIPFVREVDRTRDLLPLTLPHNNAIINNAVRRIQEEPRRIINHRCAPNWENREWGNNRMDVYVGPREVLFFRLAPNYFFGGSDNRRLRIQGAGFAPVSVCHSRTVERPRRNMNTNTTTENQQGDIDCTTVNANTFDIQLNNLCAGHDHIMHCNPLFISMEGPETNDAGRCPDRDCAPNDARVTIHAENLGCFSGVGAIAGSVFLLLLSIFFTLSSR